MFGWVLKVLQYPSYYSCKENIMNIRTKGLFGLELDNLQNYFQLYLIDFWYVIIRNE